MGGGGEEERGHSDLNEISTMERVHVTHCCREEDLFISSRIKNSLQPTQVCGKELWWQLTNQRGDIQCVPADSGYFF